MKWIGGISNTKPMLQNGKPVFIIRGKEGAVEVNTTDTKYLEKLAKGMTAPKGRQAITTDVSRIYIKEINGKETLVGIMTHDHVKKYAPMYDKVGYKNW